jgi:hypothetical protein
MEYFRYTMVKGAPSINTYEVIHLVQYGTKIKKVGGQQTAFISNAAPTVADFAHPSKAEALSALKHRIEQQLELSEASVRLLKEDLLCLNAL